MSNKDNDLAPERIGVATVPTADLKPNPHNPRMLFDRQPLATLQDSIAKVGILVPLTVYRTGTADKYIILDGQRRWMCARELELEEVPVNVVREPTLVQNIVTMFQIHKLREDWELMPTALKLEVLMTTLSERNERRLAELTRLDQAVVSRCKKLLTYPKKDQDMMLDPDPDKRVKADFFIELYTVRNDRFVNKMTWFRKNTFTSRMLQKYQSEVGGLKAVTDFRVMKQHITNARRADQGAVISRRLEEFTSDDSLSLDHLKLPEADVSAAVRSLLSETKKLEIRLSELNTREYYGELELWKALERLAEIIRVKLADAERRTRG